jgi:hypothetical protein
VGSKRALSNGNEPEELTDLVAAFEMHNSCIITLSSCLKLHSGYLDLEWRATAYPGPKDDLGATGSALASVAVWGGAFKTLKGLHSHLLYQLDFALAEHEFDKAIVK